MYYRATPAEEETQLYADLQTAITTPQGPIFTPDCLNRIHQQNGGPKVWTQGIEVQSNGKFYVLKLIGPRFQIYLKDTGSDLRLEQDLPEGFMESLRRTLLPSKDGEESESGCPTEPEYPFPITH